MTTYKNRDIPWDALQSGDIIEDILLPGIPTLRGAVGWGAQWYFRLWQAEVEKIEPRRIDYRQTTITVLRPDDPRVLDYLMECYMPSDSEIERFSDKTGETDEGKA